MVKGTGANEYIVASNKGLITEGDSIFIKTPKGEAGYHVCLNSSLTTLDGKLDPGCIESESVLRDTFRDYEWYAQRASRPSSRK